MSSNISKYPQPPFTHALKLYGDRAGSKGTFRFAGFAWIQDINVILVQGDVQHLDSAAEWRCLLRLITLAHRLKKPIILWNLPLLHIATKQRQTSLEFAQAIQKTELELLKLPHPIITVFDGVHGSTYTPPKLIWNDGVILVTSEVQVSDEKKNENCAARYGNRTRNFGTSLSSRSDPWTGIGQKSASISTFLRGKQHRVPFTPIITVRRYRMFEAKLKPRLEIILSILANKMVAIGITANMVTLFGLVVNLIAAFYLATSHLVIGGILILFGGSFDMIDGAVARAQRTLRASGALLDSVIDRYSEGFLFLGALIYFYSLGSLLGIMLAFGAWFGSILVSYVRARAEGLQVTCKVGLMQRPERIVLLGAGTLLQGVLWYKFSIVQSTGMILLCTLGILTLTSHITAIHRLIFSYQELER